MNIMKKFVGFVINKRYVFFIMFIILTIVSAFLMPYVKTNYDTTTYLEDGSPTKEALELMNSEFKTNGSFVLMVEGINEEEANKIQKRITDVEGVTSVVFDISDNNYYRYDKETDTYYALYSIFLKDNNFDIGAKEALNKIENDLDEYTIYTTGSTVESQYLGSSVNSNMIAILIVACFVVFAILMLNSISWAEPIVFIIVILVAIIINLGTNAFLDSISFVTKSICAVMQLALAMDYSIILLHRYMEEKEINPSIKNTEAIKIALKDSVVAILGSSLTTIAGLVALCCMKFKMGADIGIVLAKGIVISLFVVFLFMPCVLLLFSNFLVKAKHRSIYDVIRTKFPSFDNRIAKAQYKTRYIIPCVLGLLIVAGFVLYLRSDYAYTLEASTDPKSSINLDKKRIEEVFGIQNSVAILIPVSETQKEIITYLNNYTYNEEKVFSSVQSMITTGIYDFYTAQEVSEQYKLSIELVNDVYYKLGGNIEKLRLIDILNYLDSSNYINTYSDKLQKEYDKLYLLSLELKKSVTKEGIANLVNSISQIKISENNAMFIIEDIERKGVDLSNKTNLDLLSYIVDNNYLNNIMKETEDYLFIYDNLNVYYNQDSINSLIDLNEEEKERIFKDSDSLLLKDIIIKAEEEEITNEKLILFKLVLHSYKEEYTKNQVLELDCFNYQIYPRIMFDIIFIGKNKLTTVEIQKGILNYKDFIVSLNDLLVSSYEKASLLKTNYTIDTFSRDFQFDKKLLLDMFKSFNKEEVSGEELITYVYENKAIVTIGNELGLSFQSIMDKIAYGKSMFEGEKYTRIVLNLNYSRSSDEAMKISRELRTVLKNARILDEYYVVSESSAFIDFEDTFSQDSLKINIISFLFILIIIAISFKSLSIPIILTVIIQGAIWLTMAISVIEKSKIYFICYLMVVCIQMGTTIDYGILYTNKYLEARKSNSKLRSLEIAFRSSITTILTSGTILVVAAYLVGKISEVSIISSIGYLLSKGSLISLIFILFALPQVLLISDKLIVKTSLNYNFEK